MGCLLTIYASGSSQKKPCSLGKVAWVSAAKAVLLCISMWHWENTRQTDAPRCKGWHCGSRIGAKKAELVEVRESSGRVSLSAVLQLPSTLIARLDWRVICTGEGSLRLSLHTKVSDSQSHDFFLLGKPHGKKSWKMKMTFGDAGREESKTIRVRTSLTLCICGVFCVFFSFSDRLKSKLLKGKICIFFYTPWFG